MILVLLLSGCEIVYIIEIDGDVLYETLVIDGEAEEVEHIKRNIAEEINVEQFIDLYGGRTLRMSNRVTVQNYIQNSLLNNYDNPMSITRENNITIIRGNATEIFRTYQSLDSLLIRLVTNDNIIWHNADEERGGNLYWRFNRNNASREINIRLGEETSQSPNDSSLWELDEDGYIGTNTLIAIYIIAIGVIFLIGIVVIVKIKKANV